MHVMFICICMRLWQLRIASVHDTPTQATLYGDTNWPSVIGVEENTSVYQFTTDNLLVVLLTAEEKERTWSPSNFEWCVSHLIWIPRVLQTTHNIAPVAIWTPSEFRIPNNVCLCYLSRRQCYTVYTVLLTSFGKCLHQNSDFFAGNALAHSTEHQFARPNVRGDISPQISSPPALNTFFSSCF